MAVEIKVRETWHEGPQVSFEVEAFDEDGVKLFAPGATVTRDRRFGTNELQVTVGWPSSSSNDKKIATAEAQLLVMTEAVELARMLLANIETLALR